METPGSASSPEAAPDTAAAQKAAPDAAGPDATATLGAPGTPDAQGADASRNTSGPVWRFLVEPRWLGWHAFTVLAIWGMLWLGDWQLRRALAGNGLSWAYTFEWPLFAGFGLVFWARTVRDEYRLRRGVTQPDGSVGAAGATASAGLPEGIGTRQIEQPGDDADDEQLASYNAYLARLHSEVRGNGKRRGFW